MQSVSNDIKNPALITLPNSIMLNGLPLRCCAGIFIVEKIIGIYKITNPNGKVYIGQSVNCIHRKNKYKRAHCKTQKRIYNSIIKYGWAKHKFEVIDYCLQKELNDKEKYYVDLFQTFNSKYGLNLRDGGGNKGCPSKETRKRMSVASMNKLHTAETKIKISKTRKELYKRGELLICVAHLPIMKGEHNINAKITLNLETGIYYECGKEAFAFSNLKCSYKHFLNQLNGRKNNRTRFIYA